MTDRNRDAPGLSSVDHSTSPPHIAIPRAYNAAQDLLERNLRAGRADKLAFIEDSGSMTYGELARRVDAFAHGITALGLRMEDRALLCLHDSIDFPIAFLGCIKAGIVPIAVNTLLTAADYEFMLSDSRARALVVSAPLLATVTPLLARLPNVQQVIVSGDDGDDGGGGDDGHALFNDVLKSSHRLFAPAPTTRGDACFWLYSSGSTGAPKGTVHVHSSLIQTAELYARPILGIQADDLVFSAAKLFFAYGLGNALTFPMAVGATALLMAERPTPETVFARLRRHQPSIFYGVPTLYAGLLAHPDLPRADELRLRRCTSAGEALPEALGKRWAAHFGVDILDGIGSTEMLHIFLSNRAGDLRYGTTGKAVPGYQLRIVDEYGAPVAPGEQGDLQISGPTSAAGYWNNREKSRATFHGPWVHSGDKYRQDADGYYVYAGRSDDMLKVSGLYVSPVEVEAALSVHPSVLEAAVVGRKDGDGLVKPMAYVVLKPGARGSPELADALRSHVKARLAPFKYPRWIEFIDELPKTATGKIQRFQLRARQGQD